MTQSPTCWAYCGESQQFSSSLCQRLIINSIVKHLLERTESFRCLPEYRNKTRARSSRYLGKKALLRSKQDCFNPPQLKTCTFHLILFELTCSQVWSKHSSRTGQGQYYKHLIWKPSSVASYWRQVPEQVLAVDQHYCSCGSPVQVLEGQHSGTNSEVSTQPASDTFIIIYLNIFTCSSAQNILQTYLNYKSV